MSWKFRLWPRAAINGLGALSVAGVAILAVIPLLAVGQAVGIGLVGSAQAKTPGKTYCFYGRCHRVRTIAETKRAIGRSMVVHASFYDAAAKDRYNPSDVTSSGERFRANRPDNAASPLWPDGTLMLVWNPANKRTVVVRINNAGPYWGGRTLDLSRAAAVRLGFAHRGVAKLHAKIVSAPTIAQASYRRGRSYPPAPGFVGVFASIDSALLKVASSVGNALASSTKAVAGRQSVAADKGVTEPAANGRASSRASSRASGRASSRSKAQPAASRSKSAITKGKSSARRAVASARATKSGRSTVKVASVRAGKLDRADRSKLARAKSGRRAAKAERRKSNRIAAKGTARRSVPRAVVKSDDDDDDEARPVRRRRAVSQPRPVAGPGPRLTPPARRAVGVKSATGGPARPFRPSRCYGWPNFCGRESG